MAEKGPAVPPYGVVIQRAIASGDLAEMKRAAQEAEEHLRQTDDVRSALANLKIEIAKREHK